MYENIPKELKDLDRWVCASKTSKAPLNAFRPEAASATNPNTWAFFEQAEWAVKEGHYDYIGFVFANDGIVGIDIDCGFEDGLLTPLCVDILDKCQSYTEKSKSGRGVHIFLKGDLPFDGKNNQAGVEIYRSRRFFITTGDVFIFHDLIENQKAIDYVVQKYFSDCENGVYSADKGYSDRIYSPEWEKPKNGKIKVRPWYPEIGKGNRNNSLTSLAGSMHTTGYTPMQILDELRLVNEVACDPKLPDRDLVNIAKSVTRYRR